MDVTGGGGLGSGYGDSRWRQDSSAAGAPAKVDLNERWEPQQRNSRSCPASSCTHSIGRSSGKKSSYLSQTSSAQPQPEKQE